MTGKIPAVPEYTPPSPDLHFMASEREIYEYANLFHFAGRLSELLSESKITEKNPVLISADSSDELVFIIASAFLLNLPFIVVRDDLQEDELRNILNQIEPSCLLETGGRNKNRHPDNGLKVLKTEEKWMKREAFWNPSLFTMGKPDSVAGYFLTSGTTSKPKIVPVKRRQILFAAKASEINFKPAPNRYWLLCLPLNHIGGISIIYRSILYHSALFRMDSFDVESARTFLSENPLFEAASLVPTMLIRLMDDPLFKTHASIKAILLGGGPVSSELIDASVTRGIPIVTSYGMTETCAQIAANPILRPSGTYYPKKSVGDVFAPNKIEIRNENGKVVPSIEEGIIWLKGPQVFDGYTDPSLNEGIFDEDGWFCTGDYGHLNRYRQLFVESRRTDLIVTGGENVNPFHVESILNGMKGIRESVVFGVPDPEWGQRIIAFISKVNHNPEPETLKESLKEKLLDFQIPKEIYTVDELPKTHLGKIRRNKLEELYKKLK
jgi:o-succinylbenzoate---CoA ligase